MGRRGENIYKRKDGRWEARYIKGHTAEGNACYGYCYGKTYYEAKNKVNKKKAALFNHQPLPEQQGRMRLGVYCDEWIRLKRSQIKESTYVKYETILKKHIKPCLGNYFIERLTEVIVEQYSYSLLHEEKLSPKTVKDILQVLRAVIVYAGKQNPFMKQVNILYPKAEKKEMRVLSSEEQRCFTAYLLETMDECKFGILLALSTGLRLGEICALRWRDISLSEQTLYVRQTMQRLKNLNYKENGKTKIIITVPKSAMSMRKIPLNDDMTGLCKKWKASDPDAYILTGEADRYMEPRTLQYRMVQYTRGCGLKGVHFHTLRHSFATRCVEVGFEIKSLSEILGHSSPKITLERYVHSSMALKRENMNKLNMNL